MNNPSLIQLSGGIFMMGNSYEKIYKIAEIDRRVNTPEFAQIKAAAQGLDPKNRKLARMFIKIIEINRIMDYLQETSQALHKINTQASEKDKRSALFEFLIPYMPPEAQGQLRILMLMMGE